MSGKKGMKGNPVPFEVTKEIVEEFGGEDVFLKRKELDKIKSDYCNNENIPLLVISYKDYNDIEKIISNYLIRFH